MTVPSVVLLEVYAAGIPVLEFEGQAPGAVDVDTVARWLGALQRVEIKARHIHLFRHGRDVKAIEPQQDAPM
jgi:hypothetical protein